MTSEEAYRIHFSGLLPQDITQEKIQDYAIYFAKNKVEECVETIINDVDFKNEVYYYGNENAIFFDREKIDEVYPLNKIK